VTAERFIARRVIHPIHEAEETLAEHGHERFADIAGVVQSGSGRALGLR